MNQLSIHPDAKLDLQKAMAYYEAMAGAAVADRFYEAARAAFLFASEKSSHFSPDPNGIRRVNFERFPFHALFRVEGSVVRIYVVKHHRRRPSYGIRRVL